MGEWIGIKFAYFVARRSIMSRLNSYMESEMWGLVKKTVAMAAAVGGLSVLGMASANALPINTPVPTNAYINFGGLDWAWAAPCAPTQPSCGVIDLSYQSQFGWRLPTLAELLNGPSAFDFVFDGANVPNGGVGLDGAIFQAGSPGGDAACAAPYFSTSHFHCDWSNGNDGLWAGLQGTQSFWETLVVRGNIVDVPAPASLSLLGLGLIGMAAIRRRRA